MEFMHEVCAVMVPTLRLVGPGVGSRLALFQGVFCLTILGTRLLSEQLLGSAKQLLPAEQLQSFLEATELGMSATLFLLDAALIHGPQRQEGAASGRPLEFLALALLHRLAAALPNTLRSWRRHALSSGQTPILAVETATAAVETAEVAMRLLGLLGLLLVQRQQLGALLQEPIVCEATVRVFHSLEVELLRRSSAASWRAWWRS